ncbi:hypothetical protein ALI144C_00360 [Actinosynnema sp. ALI-1.44]|nr:hypothetical protein ALI144C_00360 [Actinosynnema sp. ALI-1.44]
MGTAIGLANSVSIHHTTIAAAVAVPGAADVWRVRIDDRDTGDVLVGRGSEGEQVTAAATLSRVTGVEELAGPGEPFAEWVGNFLAEYLGQTDGRKVPFGGRDAELAALTSWLTEPGAAPYALVTAEAGRGKSALLVTWAAQVQAAGIADVVFIPISTRFNTAQASVALPALASRLAARHGETLATTNRSADQWQAEISTYLGRSPRSDRPLLVVIDGLDEAVGWEAGAYLFPHSPPPGMRLLVSARYIGGDADETSWRHRLNWTSSELAQSIPLPPLDADGVAEVLRAMGEPLAHLVTRVDIVGELHRLSEGDPLLVRLYVESLLERGGDAVRLTPEELPSIEKGMRGYYDRWRRELDRIWQRAGHTVPGKQRELQDFLNILACAFGPVNLDDLTELNPGAPTGVELDLLVRVVGRFVIGDGVRQGFVFSHPRFGTFFYDLMGRREQVRWSAAFTDYGRRVLTAIRDGVLEAERAPSYAVTTYGAHLEAADASSEFLYELLDPAWLAAWNAVDGTDAGFLNDCERAWGRAKRDVGDARCTDLDQAVETQFLCALARAGVTARSDKVPVPLLTAAYSAGVLTAAQALAVCRRMTQEYRRSSAVVALAPLLPTQWLDECVSIAASSRREQSCAYILVGLAPLLSGQALAKARATTTSMKDRKSRNVAVIALSSRLPEPERTKVASAALSELQALSDDVQRARAIRTAARFLPSDLVGRTVDLLRNLFKLPDAARALAELTRRATGATREQAIALMREQNRTNLRIIFAEFVPELRSLALKDLKSLQRSHRTALVLDMHRWLGDVSADGTMGFLIDAVEELVRRGDHTNAAILADSMEPSSRNREWSRFSSAHSEHHVFVAAHLLAAAGLVAAPDRIATTMRVAEQVGGEAQVAVSAILAQCHRPEDRREILRHALAIAQTVGDGRDRLQASTSVLAILDSADVGPAQLAVLALHDAVAPPGDLPKFLSDLPIDLVSHVVDHVVTACMRIPNRDLRAQTLSALSHRVPESHRLELRTRAAAEALAHHHNPTAVPLILSEARSDQAQLDAALIRWARTSDISLVDLLPHLHTNEAKINPMRQVLHRMQKHERQVTISAIVQAFSKNLPDSIAGDLVAMATEPRALLALVPLLRGDLLERALEQALTAEPRLAPDEVAHAAVDAFDRLDEEGRARLLPVAIGSIDQRAARLRRIATLVPDALRESVVEAAEQLPLSQQASILRALTSGYPESLTARMRSSVLDTAPDMLGALALGDVAHLVPPDCQKALLEQVLSLLSDLSRGEAFQTIHKLAENAPESWRRQLLEFALDLAASTEDVGWWGPLLRLVPHLSGDQFVVAAELAIKLGGADRIAFLYKLLAHCQLPERSTIWSLVAHSVVEQPKHTMPEVLKHRTPPMDARVIAAVRTGIENEEEESRLPLLVELCHHLPPDKAQTVVIEAARLALALGPGRDRDRVLGTVAGPAAAVPQVDMEVLLAVVHIESEKHLRAAVRSFTRNFAGWHGDNERAWTNALHALACRPRPEMVHALALLASVGAPAGLSPARSARAFFSALQRVGVLWE